MQRYIAPVSEELCPDSLLTTSSHRQDVRYAVIPLSPRIPAYGMDSDMPLFHHSQPNPEPLPRRSPVEADEPHRSRSIFSRRGNSPDAAPSADGSIRTEKSAGAKSSSGFFGRRRSSDDDMHRNIKNDPSVVAARQRVSDAEAAEREADRALMQARIAVREAREHVERLEREALEE